MTTETKLADLPPLPATYAAGTFAPDVPVYDAGQMRAYAASALARQDSVAPPAQAVDLEQFRKAVKAALQWAQFSGDDSDRARFLDLLALIDQQAGKENING